MTASTTPTRKLAPWIARAATVVVSIVSFLSSWCLAEAPTTRPAEKTLYDRPLGEGGGHLVIVQGREHRIKLFDSIIDREVTQQLDNLCEVRVELRFPHEEPILVTSQLLMQYPRSSKENDITVLDALVEKDIITVALARGAMLELWQFSLVTGIGWSALVPSGESLDAALRPLREVARLKLSRLADKRMIGYEVTKSNLYHSTYEQREPGVTEFKLMRAWNGKPQENEKQK